MKLPADKPDPDWPRLQQHDVEEVTREQMPPGADFDAVTCTEVLEHVPAPSHLLSQLAAKACPGDFETSLYVAIGW